MTRWLGSVRTAAGGLLRHKVQAIVIGAVLLISTASATLGLALLAASDGPFDTAFAAQHGADEAIVVNTRQAGQARIAATAKLPGVTDAAGPFTLANVASSQVDGQPYGGLRIAGATPGGPVDDLVLNAGHWVTGPGQIVLNGTPSPGGPRPVTVGSVLTTGTFSLHVVGFANSVTNTADGWVEPSVAARLATAATAQGLPANDEMLYRFARAGTYAQLNADVAEVRRALPEGSVSNEISWLDAQSQSEGNGAIMEPFVVAFAVIGLVMAVLIVANVVSGAVAASYHRVLGDSRLALLSLAAVVIAVAGALLPATWAARSRPATALRAE